MGCFRKHTTMPGPGVGDNICLPSVEKFLPTNACKLAHPPGGQNAAVPISTISVSDLYWSQLKELIPTAARHWSDTFNIDDSATDVESAMSFHHGAKCFLLPSLHFMDYNRNLAWLHLNFGLVNDWSRSWLLRQSNDTPDVNDLCHALSRLQVSSENNTPLACFRATYNLRQSPVDSPFPRSLSKILLLSTPPTASSSNHFHASLNLLFD